LAGFFVVVVFRGVAWVVFLVSCLGAGAPLGAADALGDALGFKLTPTLADGDAPAGGDAPVDGDETAAAAAAAAAREPTTPHVTMTARVLRLIIFTSSS
jgi:hypothetical protein